MKSSRMSIALTIALSISPSWAQERASQEEKKSQVNAIDKAINGLKHLKACLQGKKPCSKSDFVALSTGLLFLLGIVQSIRYRLLPEPDWDTWGNVDTFSAENISEYTRRVPYYLDPSHWGFQAGDRTINQFQRRK